jgi:hypothetical protein
MIDCYETCGQTEKAFTEIKSLVENRKLKIDFNDTRSVSCMKKVFHTFEDFTQLYEIQKK